MNVKAIDRVAQHFAGVVDYGGGRTATCPVCTGTLNIQPSAVSRGIAIECQDGMCAPSDIATEAGMPADVRALVDGADESEAAEPTESEGDNWPEPMEDVAFHGPVGDYVRLIEPYTEADRHGILMHVLVALSAMCSRGWRFAVDGAAANDQHTNIFALIVGETSKGAKGTAWNAAKDLLMAVDPRFMVEHTVGGLSSGEGLIQRLRDDVETGDVARIADKRTLVVEQEFGVVLVAGNRDGSTLSQIVRQCWDGATLSVLTRKNPIVATDVHLALIGHITPEELRLRLAAVDRKNGFANRFLYICVKRARYLSVAAARVDSGRLEDIAKHIRQALADPPRAPHVRLAPAAARLWDSEYRRLADGVSGVLDTVTSRSRPIVLRLALLYAVLDRELEIDVPHLRAALAVWNYSVRSAAFAFGESLFSPLAERVLAIVRAAGAAGADTNTIYEALHRHGKARDRKAALATLAAAGLVSQRREATCGRPREIWSAVDFSRTSTLLSTQLITLRENTPKSMPDNNLDGVAPLYTLITPCVAVSGDADDGLAWSDEAARAWIANNPPPLYADAPIGEPPGEDCHVEAVA